MGSEALEQFHPAVREWFRTSFATPTPAQAQAWPAIKNGDSTLLMAPTGSGKTLAAFLSSIDTLIQSPPRGCRIVYVSPLKALAVDVERNLHSPIAGIGHAATRLGVTLREPTVAIRTGDTPAKDRVRFTKGDLFEMDYRDATVVMLYLSERLNLQLLPRLKAQLQPGARIVSHRFRMGDLKPERTINIDNRDIYLWRI